MPRQPRPSLPRQRRAAAALVAATALVHLTTHPTHAVPRTWISDTATLWNTPAAWSPTGVPTTGDTATVSLSPAEPRTITFNSNYTAATAIAGLTLNSSTAETLTLLQASNNFNLYASSETIADTGTATFAQSAATNSLSGNLTLGNAAGSSGAYSLSGTARLAVAGDSVVGSSGTGSFSQSAGTHSVSKSLYLGRLSGSTGSYNLSGGTLQHLGDPFQDRDEFIGYSGSGTFVQTGGLHSAKDMHVGYNSTGTYLLSGGSLSAGIIQVAAYWGSHGSGTFSLSGTAALTAGAQLLGMSGPATFSQSGGTNTATEYLIVGRKEGGTGTYNLSAGTLTAGDVHLGYPGDGTINMTGGTFLASAITVATSGQGTFNHSAGPVTADGHGPGGLVPGALTIGQDATATGLYTLTGTASLSTQAQYIAYRGKGSLLQSGGSNAVSSFLSIAAFNGSTGSYVLTGGTLSAGNALIGGRPIGTLPGGAGSLSISGTASATVARTLKIFDTPGSSVSLAGGSLSVGSLDLSGNPANFHWTAGSLTFTNTAADSLRQSLLTGQLIHSAPDPEDLLSIGYLQTSSTAVLAKITLTGDANLDGTLDHDDYALLDKGLATNGVFWWEGDFNYDGIITPADYLLIDSTFLKLHPTAPTFLSLRESQFGADYVAQLLTAIPEPSSAACGLALPLLLAHKKRRRAR